MKNKTRLANRLINGFAGFLALGVAAALPVQAHEGRILGTGVYSIAFGFHVEPLNANVANGLDFFADVEDPPSSGTFPKLDRNVGDKVQLTVLPFRLDTDNVDSKNLAQVLSHTVEILPPLSNFARAEAESLPLGVPNEEPMEDLGYVKAFTPQNSGAYGFYVVGEIKRKNHDGYTFPKKTFAETFVCERGSQDDGARDANGLPVNLNYFDCVQ